MKGLLTAALLLIAILGLSVVPAFQSAEKPRGSPNASQKAAQDLRLESLKEITMEYRAHGWGAIPSYDVVLHKNGTATYVGAGLMQLNGRYKGEIEREDFRQLAEFFVEEGFFELPDYDEKAPRLTHAEMTIISALRPGGRKTVGVVNREGPPQLAAFERMINRALKNIIWERDTQR